MSENDKPTNESPPEMGALQKFFEAYEKTAKDIAEGRILLDDNIIYPIGVDKLTINMGTPNDATVKQGALCSVRLAGGKETYLGFFLGNLPVNTHTSYHTEDKELKIIWNRNPSIFVPKLGRIVRGSESWWGVLRSIKDFEDITDETIDKIWYVQLAKEMFSAKKEEATDAAAETDQTRT